MKRRNADCAKLRRPIKRNKISDGMSSNTLLYVKFLFLWAIVIAADFLLEFRFEFLWPFWLLLRSVHDSFKYKGLAFSILFVCIALTSDLICLFFIPVQWLFFAASTYVWVQYVWHTDKGVCLPTIILWVIFVYLEAAIRWKDSRSMPHLDLCRPFAAHCIGYPVVTLGFGFKSYVGFRIRQRKQREVAKENDFYMQLLQQALPQEEAPPLLTMDQQLQPQEKEASPVMVVHKHAQSSSATNNNISNSKLSSFLTASMSGSPVTNGHLVTSSFAPSSSSSSSSASSSPVAAVTANGIGHHSSSSKQQVNGHHQQQQQQQNHRKGEGAAASTLKSIFQQFGGSNGGSSYSKTSHSSAVAANECKNHDKDSPKPQHYDMSADKKLQNGSVHHHFEHDTMQQTEPPESCEKERKGGRKNRTRQSKSNATPESSKDNHQSAFLTNGHSSTAPDLFGSTPFLFAAAVETPVTPPPVVPVKACEACPRLESDLKKTKAELSSSRQTEADLRQKVESHATVKSCLQAKQKENDELHAKLQDQTNLRQIERQSVQTLERRLTEERRQRQSLEAQLNNERKYRKAAEEKAARPECSDSCRMKKQQLENEINKMRRDFVAYEEMKHNFEKQSQRYEQELRKMEQELRNRGEQQHSDQMNLNDLRMKNATLEKNLSAETRVKLDLFSALGASKREVELRDSQLRDRNNELLDLKAKIAQLLAVMPTDFNLAPSAAVSQASSAIFKLNDGSGNAIGQRASPLAHLSNVNSGVQGGHLGGNGTLGQLNLVNLTTPNGQPSLDPNAKTYTPKNSSLVSSTEA